MADNVEVKLPDNARRELKPGEVYEPVVPPGAVIPEVTNRSVLFGIAMTVLFSGAAAYIALRIGQGMESAVPISILAVGFSALLARKSTLLENINILAIGATSGIIVGGSVFTMPAVYILKIEHLSGFFQIFVVPLFGAILGVLFLIPFRRYFVHTMHGKLPFPEGTAITEILITGEKGGSQAKVLAYAMAIGAVFDFVGPAMRAWAENFTTATVGALSTLTHKVKAIFVLNTSAAILGMGYLIGIRYSAIIFAGSMTSYFVLVPLFAHLGQYIPAPITQGLPPLSEMSAEDIFFNYARYVGIGGIFTAGLISIGKMSPVIVKAIGEAFGQIRKSLRGPGEEVKPIRTERDLKMSTVSALILLTAALIFLYFRFSVLVDNPSATFVAAVALVLTMVIAFLFAAVSAWAVAMISVTPVSGMTLMTLMVSSVLLLAMGLRGQSGMLAALLIGGVVCTALSMTGSLVTQFKISHWLGATPRSIEWSNILACMISSVTVTGVIILFAQISGYAPGPNHPNPMPAPQANAMSAVLSSLMGGGKPMWFLYGLGGVFACVAEMLGVSALAFALGMYLPIELNSPILLGAIVAWFVKKSSRNEALSNARSNRGLLIASGLIAGGAIIGVLTGLVQLVENESGRTIIPNLANTGPFGNWLGLAVFLALAIYLYWDSCRAKAES
jgi:putative OPT family oligopeptide transporter